MKETYKLILDEEKLKDFIENDLPDLKSDEIYYITLFSRGKYSNDETIKKSIGDKAQLKRVTATKDFIIRKIKQMEVSVGNYISKGGDSIPEETLAVYITINPRSIKKAYAETLKTLTNNFINDKFNKPPNVIGFDSIQVSRGTNYFNDWDFDVDKREYNINNLIEDVLNKTPLEVDDFNIIETRGGYHLLIKNKSYEGEKRKWYMYVKKLHEEKSDDKTVELDKLVPLPYCRQGNFMPIFY